MAKRGMQIIFIWLTLILMSGGVGAAAMHDTPNTESRWTRGADMPSRRSEIGSALLDGQIYVAGGIGENWTTRTEVERYDVATDSWETVAPLPIGLHHLGMAAAAGQVYVSGGYADMNFTINQSTVYAYNPTADSWSKMADMPTARAAHAMVAIEDKLYIVGGVGERAEELWIYDPMADTWDESAPPLPTPREHLAAANLNGGLAVVGGRTDQNLAVLEMYDPTQRTWFSWANMPTPRGGLTAGAMDGRLHVTGGEIFEPAATYDQHEVYETRGGGWTTLEPMPTARHGLTSIAFEGRWYVIGGATGAAGETSATATSLVEIYNARLPYPDDTLTGISIVDDVIAAYLNNDIDTLRSLVSYRQLPCIQTPEGLGGPPICKEGEADGTLVTVIPVLFSEGSYVREANIDSQFQPGKNHLYAVYQVSNDAYEDDYFPAGEYGIVFVDETYPAYNAITLLVTADGIVRIDYGELTEELTGRGIGDFILPPRVPVGG